MELKKIEHNLTVCKVRNVSDIDITSEFFFTGKTDEEISSLKLNKPGAYIIKKE